MKRMGFRNVVARERSAGDPARAGDPVGERFQPGDHAALPIDQRAVNIECRRRRRIGDGFKRGLDRLHMALPVVIGV